MPRAKFNQAMIPEKARRRSYPVNMSFKQFRYYIEVLKEGGEEKLREAVEREEEYQEQLSNTSSNSGRTIRSFLQRSRSRDVGDSNAEIEYCNGDLSPAARAELLRLRGVGESLPNLLGDFEKFTQQSDDEISKQRRDSNTNAPARRLSVQNSTSLRKVSVFERPTGIEDLATSPKDPQVEVDTHNKSDTQLLDESSTKVQISASTPSHNKQSIVKGPRRRKSSRYSTVSQVASDTIPEHPELANMIDSRLSLSDIKENQRKAALKARRSVPSARSIRIAEMNARALERYEQALVEKEKEFLKTHARKTDRSRLHRSVGLFRSSPLRPRNVRSRYLSAFELHNIVKDPDLSAGSDKFKRSSARRRDRTKLVDAAPVLPSTWCSGLAQEEVHVFFNNFDDQQSVVSSNKGTSRAANGNRSRTTSEKVSNTSRRSSVHNRQQSEGGSNRLERRRTSLTIPPDHHATGCGTGTNNSTHQCAFSTMLPPADTKHRHSVGHNPNRRGSAAAAGVDPSTSIISRARRESIALEARRSKSASSRNSVSTNTTTGTGSDRSGNKGGAGGLAEQPKKRTRYVYRAEPPIPLRIYLTQREKTKEKFVDGIVDEQGLPLLPVSRRHIMSGLVYQKMSRSLIPPRPADMRHGIAMRHVSPPGGSGALHVLPTVYSPASSLKSY